jgi:hypothetical protein
MTLVQLCYPVGLYILLTYKAWDLFFIGENQFPLCLASSKPHFAPKHPHHPILETLFLFF